MNQLDVAFYRCSPRLAPRPAPLISYILTIGVTLLWLGLLSRAVAVNSLLAWSAGIVYVGYDTFLIVFITLTSFPLVFKEKETKKNPQSSNHTVGKYSSVQRGTRIGENTSLSPVAKRPS